MFYTEMNYRDYFHKVLVFEVDNLTDDLKNIIDIEIDDCFIMCCNFMSDTNELMFAVLGVGNSVTNCFKGLELSIPLKIYPSNIISKYPVFNVETNFNIIAKASDIIDRFEYRTNKLEILRNDESLDFLRNPLNPDELLISTDNKEYSVKITNVNNSIITGIIKENGNIVKAISYNVFGESRLISIITSKDASKDEVDAINDFLKTLAENINEFDKNKNIKS